MSTHQIVLWLVGLSALLAQNVGIGTTTPAERLEVAGNVGLRHGAPAFIGTLDAYRLELRVDN